MPDSKHAIQHLDLEEYTILYNSLQLAYKWKV